MLLNWVMDYPEGLPLAFCNILYLHTDMGTKTTHMIMFCYSSERCFGKGIHLLQLNLFHYIFDHLYSHKEYMFAFLL